MEKAITKDMIIGEILELDPNMAQVLMSGGMHCVTCPASLGESLEEACYVHGIDPEMMEARLNAFYAAFQEQKAQEQAAEKTE